MHIDNKWRWVFSPLENVTSEDGKLIQELPLVRKFALRWEAPLHVDGKALVYCELTASQLTYIEQDPSFIVLGSIHDDDPVHDTVVGHHAKHGAKKGMKLKELLKVLSKLHRNFEPKY